MRRKYDYTPYPKGTHLPIDDSVNTFAERVDIKPDPNSKKEIEKEPPKQHAMITAMSRAFDCLLKELDIYSTTDEEKN